MERNKISGLEVKEGLFEAGKIHTSYYVNLSTLAFYVQSPELWAEYCKTEPESAAILKETLTAVLSHWQNLIQQQGLSEETEVVLG
jgi:hypothetical protein